MENNHVTEMLPDYLDGLLEPSQRKSVEKHLNDCKTCAREMTELKELFAAISLDKEITPPSIIKTKFLKQLEEEKNSQSKVISLNLKSESKRNPWTSDLLKIAASVALLLGGFLLGKQQSRNSNNLEIAQLTEEKLEVEQTAMISLMENKSASRRIQGVNYIEAFEEPDETIIKALTERMLHDENTNVRAAAVEVLADFTNTKSVKDAFIKALKLEKDPGIQISIIRTLGKIQEKKAATPMKELFESDETQPFVKEQIESVLPNII